MTVQAAPTTVVRKAGVNTSRMAIGIEYDGTAYYGYQTQLDSRLPTIQAELEKALSQVAGGQSIELHGSGRTDAGVHACEQVAHFQSPVARSAQAWMRGANRYLPADIRVIWAQPVADSFHARFNACQRRYRYVLYSDPVRPALLRKCVTWTHKPLDAGLMHQAAQQLLGKHDFTSFRASECQAKSPVKCIQDIHVSRFGCFVVIDVRADGFLHHMVRNIAGTLLPVGAGEQPVSWVADVLARRERACAGVTAPPSGLYLVRVEYPEEYALQQRTPGPGFLSAMPDLLVSKSCEPE